MRAEHEAALLSAGVESQAFAVYSSTLGLLLSPPPSHSETCMPTACTRNFLGKPSSNLHVFLFPALGGKGFSTPAWHALSEDPVVDGVVGTKLVKKTLQKRRRGWWQDWVATRWQGRVLSTGIFSQWSADCYSATVISDSAMRRHHEWTKHHTSPPDTRQLALFSVMSGWPWPTM